MTRAVTVGVGFDDGDDAGSNDRASAGAAVQSRFAGKVSADGFEVGFKSREIDARR